MLVSLSVAMVLGVVAKADDSASTLERETRNRIIGCEDKIVRDIDKAVSCYYDTPTLFAEYRAAYKPYQELARQQGGGASLDLAQLQQRAQLCLSTVTNLDRICSQMPNECSSSSGPASGGGASSGSNCGTVNCWDYCESRIVTLSGDTCTQNWDSLHTCNRASSSCSSSGGPGEPAPPPSCGGTISCWDACTGTFVPVTGNTCSQSWDGVGSCFTAAGSCN